MGRSNYVQVGIITLLLIGVSPRSHLGKLQVGLELQLEVVTKSHGPPSRV